MVSIVDALNLMFSFGMFIVTLHGGITEIFRKETPLWYLLWMH
ncbi:TPA: putative holin-like toxin [Staphylococcus aureus]